MRLTYGGTRSDYVQDTAGNVKPGTVVEVRDAATEAVITDLVAPADYNGTAFPAGKARSDADGLVAFQGPDGFAGDVDYRAVNAVGVAGPWVRLPRDAAAAVAALEATLPLTYASVDRLNRRRFVAFGDSIVAGGAVSGTAVGANWEPGNMSWAMWAAALSKQNLLLVSNAGIGGDNTAQMLARVQTAVVDLAPDMCIIGGPTNDVTQGVAPATTLANIQGIVAACRAGGIEPVLCSLTPHAANAVARRRLSLLLREYAFTNGIRYVDFYTPVADPAGSGAYLAAYTGDSTHPNQKGAIRLGQAVVDTLLGGVPVKPGIWTPGSNADALNLWPNAFAQTDVNADGHPDGWVIGGSATSATRSIANDATVAGGKIAQLNIVSGPSSFRTGCQVTSGLTVGNRYAALGRVKTSGVEAGAGNWFIQANWQDAGGIGKSPIYKPLGGGQIVDLADGYFYLETTMPAAATKLDVRLMAVAGANYTLGLAEVGVIDLTAAGASGYQPQA